MTCWFFFFFLQTKIMLLLIFPFFSKYLHQLFFNLSREKIKCLLACQSLSITSASSFSLPRLIHTLNLLPRFTSSHCSNQHHLHTAHFTIMYHESIFKRAGKTVNVFLQPLKFGSIKKRKKFPDKRNNLASELIYI